MKIKILFLFTFINCLIQAQKNSISIIANLLDNYQYDSVLMFIKENEHNDTLDLRFQKGLALKGLKRYKRALSTFHDLYESDTTNLKVIIETANCYKQLSNTNESIKYLQNGLTIYQSNSYLKIQIANNFYSLRKYKIAHEFYNYLFESDTNNHFLVRQLARCYDKRKLIDSAQIFYNKAIIINESDYHSLFSLANIYIKKKDFNTGKEITDNYINSDSLNTKINRVNAYLYYLDKDYEKAIDKFQNCITNNDTSNFVNKFLGLSYYKMEYHGYAKPFLEKSYFSDTLNTEILYCYAQSCIKSYYKKTGIYYLNKLIGLITPSPESLSGLYLELAKANNSFSKPQAGLNALLKAKELTPTDTLIIFKLARQYDTRFKNHKNEALAYYEQFLKFRPEISDSLIASASSIDVDFYEFTQDRINELKEELFWQKNNTEQPDN